MFGHQDDQAGKAQSDDRAAAALDALASAPILDPNTGAAPAAPTIFQSHTAISAPAPAPEQPLPTPVAAPEEPAAPAPASTAGTPAPAPTPSATAMPVSRDELLQIKQTALDRLSPIVGHLQQTPEEKFRTTMMMIQASDNPELIKVAYDAANQIEDEKIKAQALLDVINEINYFTHQNDEK